MSHDLTARQAEILDYIRRSDLPPTRAEIALHFGFASTNAADEHVKALARKGFLRLTPGIARGIHVARGAA